MKLISIAEDEPAALTPEGAERRVLSYGPGLMLVEFRFAAGVAAAEHSHPHEQVGYVVDGEIDFFMAGREPVRLGRGGSYYVPPNARHYIVTHTATVLLDAFAPVREDFLAG